MWSQLKKRVSVTLGTAVDGDDDNNADSQQHQHHQAQNDDSKSAVASSSGPPLLNSSAWYTSPTYKQLIAAKTSSSSSSSSAPFISSKIDMYLDGNYNEYDDTALQQLVLSQPDAHAYSHVVGDALSLLNQWRKWKNLSTKIKGDGQADEWKLLSKEKVQLDAYDSTHLQCYWNHLPGSSVCATKGEMIVPYACPMVCGIVENTAHEMKYEEYIECVHDLQYLSPNCTLLYGQSKTANFMIAKRDFLVVSFTYVLPNAEVIMGLRSIAAGDAGEWESQIAQLNPGHAQYVRANYTLDVYHLRPWYEYNANYTKVAYYSHLDVHGNVPTWIMNNLISDTPKVIGSLRKYMDANRAALSVPGEMFFPADMLPYVGVYPDETSYRVLGLKQKSQSSIASKKARKRMESSSGNTHRMENQEVADVHDELTDLQLKQARDRVRIRGFEEEDGHKSSDLGHDDEDDVDDGIVSNQPNLKGLRRRSGVDDIADMQFAYDDDTLSSADLNSAAVYHNDEFVVVETKLQPSSTVVAEDEKVAENGSSNHNNGVMVDLPHNMDVFKQISTEMVNDVEDSADDGDDDDDADQNASTAVNVLAVSDHEVDETKNEETVTDVDTNVESPAASQEVVETAEPEPQQKQEQQQENEETTPKEEQLK